MVALVEKPKGKAPSNLMIPGRYILQPEVMQILDAQEPGAGGEIQLTDAMAKLIGRQPFHGFTFDGTRYDCGDMTGYAQANLALALGRSGDRSGAARFRPHAAGMSRVLVTGAAGFIAITSPIGWRRAATG